MEVESGGLANPADTLLMQQALTVVELLQLMVPSTLTMLMGASAAR